MPSKNWICENLSHTVPARCQPLPLSARCRPNAAPLRRRKARGRGGARPTRHAAAAAAAACGRWVAGKMLPSKLGSANFLEKFSMSSPFMLKVEVI